MIFQQDIWILSRDFSAILVIFFPCNLIAHHRLTGNLLLFLKKSSLKKTFTPLFNDFDIVATCLVPETEGICNDLHNL